MTTALQQRSTRRSKRLRLPLCPITGKRRFRDVSQAKDFLTLAAWARRQANAAGDVSPRREVRFYECDQGCGGIHVTSHPRNEQGVLP